MKQKRNDQAKANYKKLIEAGFSPTEARSKRYNSNPDKLIKEKIRTDKKTARQEQARENYKALKDAGFSAKEAERYRYSKPENIKKVIKEKKLPPISAAKQGAKKIKVKKTNYKKAGITMLSIELGEATPMQIKKALKEMQSGYNDGYRYFNIVINYKYPDEKESTSVSYNPNLYQGAMIPIKIVLDNNQDELYRLIKSDIKDNEIEKGDIDFGTLLAVALERLMNRYGGIADIDDIEEDEQPIITVTLNLWKPKK